MSKKFSKFIISKKLTLCTFPNDTKITTGCLITDPSKVEAFYAHLGCNLLAFRPIYSKITLVNLLSKHKMLHFYCKKLNCDSLQN